MRSAAPYTASSCSRTTSSNVTVPRTIALGPRRAFCAALPGVPSAEGPGSGKRRRPPRTPPELKVTIRDVDTSAERRALQALEARERVARDREPLARRRGSGFDADRGRAEPKALSQDLEEGAVRRAVHRGNGHAHVQDAGADPGDRGPRGARDQAHREARSTLPLLHGQVRHQSAGGRIRRTSCSTSWRSTSAMSGEKSMPAAIGRARRIGDRIGSVIEKMNSPRPHGRSGGNKDRVTRSKIAIVRAWQSMLEN